MMCVETHFWFGSWAQKHSRVGLMAAGQSLAGKCFSSPKPIHTMSVDFKPACYPPEKVHYDHF